jgi:hypothetical protein
MKNHWDSEEEESSHWDWGRRKRTAPVRPTTIPSWTDYSDSLTGSL